MYENLIAEFANASAKNEKDVKQYIKQISEGVDYMQSHGISKPNEKDFADYELYLRTEKRKPNGEPYGERTIQNSFVARLRNFYTWRKKKETELSMDIIEMNNNIDELMNINSNEVMSNNSTEPQEIKVKDEVMSKNSNEVIKQGEENMNTLSNEVMSKNSKQSRINFLIDEETHKKLSLIVTLKKTTVTELLRSYINDVVSKNSNIINELMNADIKL